MNEHTFQHRTNIDIVIVYYWSDFPNVIDQNIHQLVLPPKPVLSSQIIWRNGIVTIGACTCSVLQSTWLRNYHSVHKIWLLLFDFLSSFLSPEEGRFGDRALCWSIGYSHFRTQIWTLWWLIVNTELSLCFSLHGFK